MSNFLCARISPIAFRTACRRIFGLIAASESPYHTLQALVPPTMMASRGKIVRHVKMGISAESGIMPAYRRGPGPGLNEPVTATIPARRAAVDRYTTQKSRLLFTMRETD